jgi:hypothetical protein
LPLPDQTTHHPLHQGRIGRDDAMAQLESLQEQ